VGDRYVRMEGKPAPIKPPRYGEGSDYYKGVKPSHLKTLDNRELYTAANRIYTTLSEGRGTAEEIARASEAYAEVTREARARRATLHD
jgi:hypothetical protein